jgi:hypothetical protein
VEVLMVDGKGFYRSTSRKSADFAGMALPQTALDGLAPTVSEANASAPAARVTAVPPTRNALRFISAPPAVMMANRRKAAVIADGKTSSAG